MIFIATKIIVGIHVLVYFGTSLVVCNEDIPFCDKRLKELRKDEKDWSERCLNGEGENLVTPSCEAKKEYNHERMCVYTKICFYKGPYAEPYLLIKSKSEIHAIDLTTLDTTVIIGGIAGRTMDIDTVDNKLYIADNNSISRVNLDDICVEVILQNVSVRDMAIDLLRSSRRIFWTEYLEKQIFVADLGDKKKRVLMKTTNYPSRIAFDAKLKYLFWTEPIAKFVRRINLVSNDIVTFASRKFSKSYAIAVDCTKKRVYWLENEIQSGVHHIFSSDYYGYDQKSIVSGSLNDYLLGVFGGSLYYLNNDLFSINEMNVCNGTISRNILVDNNTYYDDLVVVHSSIQPQERLAPCKPKTDLIFVLDRSGSIAPGDFDKMREFVKEIAKELKVGERNEACELIGQAAIVTFSEEGEKRITLAESQDANKFYDVVDRMPGPLLGGRTKTHRGLAIADKEIAIKEAGYREDDPDVKKMIMVMTDGEQTFSVRRGFVYVGDAIKPFFNRNMDVFAIGVGLYNDAAINEVKDMVEIPENAILAANYSDLLHRVGSIIKKFCPVTGICGTPDDDCSVFATCADTRPGTYNCTCNKGYTGNGKICKGVTVNFTKKAYSGKEGEPALPEIIVSAGNISEPITISVTPSAKTAGNDDFVPQTVDVTFQPGETGPKLIPINIIDDDVVESKEEFTVTMSSSSPGVTVGEPATVIIKDNDKSVTGICGTPDDDCSVFATCADTRPGTYNCTCNKGYTGNGKTCQENQPSKPTVKSTSKKMTRTFTVSTTPAILPSQSSLEDKGTTDDSSKIIIIVTTVGAGVFLSIVLIVLLMKYKRRQRAPKLSTPVNIPLATNETSPEPLPVDEQEEVYETVVNVDQGFYEDVDTNANASEEVSSEGRTSDHEEVEVPSNAQKVSGHTELNKRPDTLKSGATGDGDHQAHLKEDNEYVVPVSEEPQHETSGQNETCEEPKLSPENPVYTELDVNGKNTTEDGTYQEQVKQDSDYVTPAHERRESYENMKMGGNVLWYVW